MVEVKRVMKKLYVTLLISLLFAFLPAASAVQIHTNLNVEKKVATYDHPDWADGGFVGVWGLKNHTLGYFAGYYGHRGRAQFFVGVWNTTDGSKWGYIKGITIGPYVLGKVNVSGDNRMVPIVGLFAANETRFIAKIMGVRGVVGAVGRYQPFD